MSRTRLTFKNRAEWLQSRTQGIGASEVPTILGVNPWETPLQLWRRKKGLDEPKVENFAMKAGHYLEDAVSKFYADETGAYIIQSSKDDFMFVNDEKPFLRVSPDRLYWQNGMAHNEANKCILECKTTQMEVDDEELPKHWFCQLQMNLGVSEIEHGALAWLTKGRTFGYRDFTFDKDFFDWMVEEVERFWVDNIQGDKEPPVTTVDDVFKKYSHSRSTATNIVADEKIMEQVSLLKSINEQAKNLEAQGKECKANIIKYMDKNDTLTLSDNETILCTYKSAKDSQKFDEKAFKADNPELYQKYLINTAGSRRFLLK